MVDDKTNVLAMNTPTQPLEKIASEEYLDRAFEDAKDWCKRNLPYHLDGLTKGFDYTKLKYEVAALENDMTNVEVDPESMFVREITKSIISRSFVLRFYCGYKLGLLGEDTAYMIENLNRKQRGLKERPEL
jgi:hypothetical protein